jgi:Cys-tRNA synthase (O-phospho-L-seryl-tRNA:Cys-tRNA synthase)
LDYSQRQYQWSLDAVKGCRKGGLRGSRSQRSHYKVDALGIYSYSKKLESGEARAATVEVYLLRIKEQLKKWPEKGKRKLSWVSTKEAVGLVEEPGVVPLLHRLMEFEDTLANSERGLLDNQRAKRRG